MNLKKYNIGKNDYYSIREIELLDYYKNHTLQKRDYYVYNIIVDDYYNLQLSINDKVSIAYHLYKDKKYNSFGIELFSLFCKNKDFENTDSFINEVMEIAKNDSIMYPKICFNYAKLLLEEKTFIDALPYFERMASIEDPGSSRFMYFLNEAFINDKNIFDKYTKDNYLYNLYDDDKDQIKQLLIMRNGKLTESQEKILKRLTW